jgi:hypothetical protein
VQIVNVVLHLVRNLAFIKDLPANVHLSADQAELASLQSKLIRTLSQSNFLDLLLTVASSAASDAMFNAWNALVLEIFYLLFRGVKPADLVLEQGMVSVGNFPGNCVHCRTEIALASKRGKISDSSSLPKTDAGETLRARRLRVTRALARPSRCD